MLPPPKKVNNWVLKQNYELKESVKRLAFELNATFKVFYFLNLGILLITILSLDS
jgi:cancer susceptibility candidate protein 1